MDLESARKPGKAKRYCAGAGERGGRGSQSKYRLPRTERLCKAIEFTEVIFNGVSVDRGLYRAYILFTPGRRRKAGFVARKSVGGACERNRARRLLKEAYRRLRPELVEDGFRVVFVARKPFKNLKSTEVMADMAKVFKQHGLEKE